MTRIVEVDLDEAIGLERVWAELKRYRAIRDADPTLRAAIIRRCACLATDVAAPILQALDELHPAVVLESFFTAMVPNVATIGAVRRGRGES